MSELYRAIMRNILYLYLLIKTNPFIIKQYLSKKKYPQVKRLISNKGIKKVSAVQLQAELYKNPLPYLDKMYDMVKSASEHGSELIVFPEYNSIQLLGMLPNIEKLSSKKMSEDNRNAFDGILNIFTFMSPIVHRVYLTAFKYLAKRFNIYIMGGSIIESGNGNNHVYNAGYLFYPDGITYYSQKKLQLMPVEKEWGFKTGDCLHVFDTSIGKISIPVCMDATYFEVFRICELKDADMVIIPMANADIYNFWKILRGIWARVQETTVFGIRSALVGTILNMEFSGKAGIYASLYLTKDLNGIIAEAETPNGEEIVHGELDYESLYRLREEHPYLGDKNIDLYKKYFSEIYK